LIHKQPQDWWRSPTKQSVQWKKKGNSREN
jgi:hypothetical protein